MDFYSMNLAAGMSGGGGGGSSNVVVISATPNDQTTLTINATFNDILAFVSAHKFVVVEIDATAVSGMQLSKAYGFLNSVYKNNHSGYVEFYINGPIEKSITEADYDQPIVLSY